MTATIDAAAIREPADEAGVAEIVREARARGEALEIVGGGTKRAIGRPMQTPATLSTARLTGITLYEPSELVIAARAGTPLAQIEAELATRRQRLPFEPIDYRVLLASQGEPTIGAVAAANLGGPRRIYTGAARDSLIGVRMVSGRGEVIKSGGRVMKNVTGYDLVKLSAGSWGTLGVLTEVTFKVLPVPETETTLVFHGLDATQAIDCMAAALGSPFEITGAAHLPAGIGGQVGTFLRIEGFPEQMDYRSGQLRDLLRAHGAADTLDADTSRALWARIRDAQPFAESEGAVWRVSVAPSRGAQILAAVEGAGGTGFLDWGGGLVWALMPQAGDAGAGAIRGAVAGRGHATLVRANASLRAAIEVFEPLAAPLARLSAGVKAAFDPDIILNPGRMYA